MNQIKGYMAQSVWLSVWLFVVIVFCCMITSVNAQIIVQQVNTGSAPTWLSQSQSTDTGDVVLEWLPVAGSDYYHIQQSFTPPPRIGKFNQSPDISPHYVSTNALAVARRQAGSYEFKVKACSRAYDNGSPLGAPSDSCTAWSNEITLTVTAQALVNSRQVTAPDLSQRTGTTDGPNLITPGEWVAPSRKGHGWSFFWANRLRSATEAGMIIDPAFDLVGVWYTFGQIIPGNDEWVPVWLYMSMQQTPTAGVYEGNIMHGSYIVNGECPIGERFVPQDRDNDVETCRVDIGDFTLDFSNPASPKASWAFQSGTGFCNEDNIPCLVSNVDLLSGEDTINQATVNNPQTPIPDLEHYSGFWWSWDNPPEAAGEADLDQRYGLSRFIEGNVEANGLIYYDDDGYRIWSRFDDVDVSTPPSASNTSFCGRYRTSGYPAGLPYEDGSLGPTVQISCTPTNGKFRRSLQTNFGSDILRVGNLDIDFVLPPEAERQASLNTGSVQHRKATSFNDVRLFVNGSAIIDEDFICYTGSGSATQCPQDTFNITLNAFTDFDYNTILRRVNADNGESILETSLGGVSTLVDYAVKPVPAGRYFYALYRIIPGSETLLAKSSITEVRQGSDPNVLPSIPDADLNAQTLHTRPDHNPTVGKLAGNAGVSGGAASYNIPINAPPGRNGMQPSVSINYNSRAGNGLLGMGWSLAAGSSISRCPATVAQDGNMLGITFTENDRLCLDGQRLIRVNGTNYWSGGGEFRTEIESFKRIKMLTGSGPTSVSMSFKVENKDGTVDVYGATSASRGSVFRDSGSPLSQTVSWHINSKTGPSGNRIDYLYRQGNRTGGQIKDLAAPSSSITHGAGEIVLAAIAYTSKGSAQGTRRVEFVYNDRCMGTTCDDSISYVAGFHSEQLLALSKVQTCISSGVCGTANMIRDYNLTYSPSQTSGRLLLRSAQERARDGAAWIALPQTSFNWGDEQPQYSFEKLKLSGQTLVNSAAGACNDGVAEPVFDDFDYCNWGDSTTDKRPPAIRMAGDYDGNGTREILAVIGGNRYLIGTDAEGNMLGKARFNIDSSTEFITNESLRSDADFNNDGRVDIVGIAPSATDPDIYVYAVAQWKPSAVWTNNSNQFVSDFFIIRPTNITIPGVNETDNGNNNEAAPINIPMIADINSDGRKDILLLGFDGTTIDVYLNNDSESLSAGVSTPINFAAPQQLTFPDFNGNVALARPSLQDFDGDGAVDIGIQATVSLGVGGHSRLDGNGVGFIGALFNNLPRTPNVTELNQAFVYTAASQFGAAGDITANMGLVFDPRKTFHLPLDINGDGLTDYLYMPAGDGGETPGEPQGHFWHYQLNKGAGSTNRANLYRAPVNTTQPVGRILILNPATTEQRQFPAHAGMIRAVDSNNDGHQELLVPASVNKAACLKLPINDNRGVGTYCPIQPFLAPQQSDGCEDITSRTSGTNESCEIYAKGFGNSDQSLYAMSILSFDYDHQSATYRLTDVTEATGSTRPVSGNAFSSDDLFGDGITDLFARVGCTGPDPANGSVIGIDQTNCGNGVFTDNNNIPPDDLVGSDVDFLIKNGRNYYHNKLINKRTNVLDLMQSVTDGFNLKSEWDYAPLSSNPNRPVSFPLYATPSRETGDSMFRGAGSEGMDDYFLFTSSMYVVSSFKSSNGASLNTQNTTWYGYEEAVFNNKGRGFQGFKAIHSEMHAPDDNNSSFAANPRTRSTTIFRQDFPYSGLIECQYTVLASDGFAAATECPLALSTNTRPRDINVNPITLTINTWSKLGNISPGTVACGSHRGGRDPAVFLPYNDTSISESRKLGSSGSLVSSTATTTTLDNCGNVTLQTQDRTDHGFYTLSSTITSDYDYNQVANGWWLNKTTLSKTSKSIVYDSPHALPDITDLSGFTGTGQVITTSTSFSWNTTHRQPLCILQFEGNASIGCGANPGGTWTRQNIVYDTYGNTSTVTQTASNESISRQTVTVFGGEGYFPTRITNAMNQSTNSVFDPATGNPIRITDANGLLTKFQYDAFGREIERYFPDNDSVGVLVPAQQYAPRTSTRYQWSSSCSAIGTNCYTVKTITDGAPIVTETRDRLNRVIQITRSGFNGDITSGTLYNGRGQVIEQHEPRYGTSLSSIGTTFSYDALGRVITKIQDRDLAVGTIDMLYTHYQHSGLHTRVRLTNSATPPQFSATCANNTINQLLCVDRYIGSQGQTLQTVDAKGAHTMFWYDANLNPVLIEDADFNLTAANYNAFSQRTALWDPNMGGTSTSADMTFDYNGYGELKTQTDAKGQSISFTYDQLGRMKTRNAPGIQDMWSYDPSGAIGQLDLLRRNQNGQTVFLREFSYDEFARVTGHSTRINNTSAGQQVLEVQIQPDGYFGRPVSMIYPSAFADTALPLQTYHLYDINGYLKQEGLGRWLVDTPPGQAVPYYRKINNMSPRDQLVNVEYDNDAVDTWTYGVANGQMSTMVSSVPGGGQLADLAYGYDDFGNLIEHDNQLLDVRETFFYDQLQRLTWREFIDLPDPRGPGGPSAPVPDPQPMPFEFPEGVNYSYDALGNIQTKSDYADNYQYQQQTHTICPFGIIPVTPGPHAVTQVRAQVKSFNGGTTPQDYRMAYDANGNLICSEDGNLTVQYDAYNLPTRIQRGITTQTFHYGPDLQRYRQVSSGAETLYIDKLYERKGNKERYYVGGYLVIERSSAGQDTHSYTHKDRLGSTVAITDGAGDIKVQQGFGPFGKARNEFWEAKNHLPGNDYDSRGFTDHEHLENTRLIHMNGRAYDFNLGRFLSIDPIIQFPENSQSLNPYSYLMNNPMAGTDPTGYCVGSQSLEQCVDSLDPGQTEDVTDADGNKIGSVTKTKDGSLNISGNNGHSVQVTFGTTNTGTTPESIGSQSQQGKTNDSPNAKNLMDGVAQAEQRVASAKSALSNLSSYGLNIPSEVEDIFGTEDEIIAGLRQELKDAQQALRRAQQLQTIRSSVAVNRQGLNTAANSGGAALALLAASSCGSGIGCIAVASLALTLAADAEIENQAGSSVIKDAMVDLQIEAGVNRELARLNADRVIIGLSVIQGRPGPRQFETVNDVLQAIENTDLSISISEHAQEEINAVNRNN